MPEKNRALTIRKYGTRVKFEIPLTMLFCFNEHGLIESVRAGARGRTIEGKVVPTPWEGHWSRYELSDGMRIPDEGEAAWVLPEGPKAYWRGCITGLKYEFAPCKTWAIQPGSTDGRSAQGMSARLCLIVFPRVPFLLE